MDHYYHYLPYQMRLPRLVHIRGCNTTRQLSAGTRIEAPSQDWEDQSLSTSRKTGQCGATNAELRMMPFPRSSDQQRDTLEEIAQQGSGRGRLEQNVVGILKSTLFVPACI